MATALTSCDWFQFRGESSRTGFNGAEKSLSPSNAGMLTELWRRATAGPVDSSPSIADRRVFVGSNDGTLYSLFENTGTRAWTRQLGGTVTSSPAEGDGDVYIGTPSGAVDAFAADTGVSQWSAQTGGPVFSSPAVASDRVYIGSSDGKVYAFDAKGVTNCSGTPTVCQPLWTFATGGAVASSPAVNGNVVVVGSDDHHLYSLDGGTGALMWSAMLGGRIRSTPAVANGRVYVGSDDGAVTAFDSRGAIDCSGTPTTCQAIWSVQTGTAVDASVAVTGNSVYVAGEDGQLRAVDASSGATQWSVALGSGAQASPAVANGVVFVGTDAGSLAAYTATAGQLLWSTTTGGPVVSSPAVIDGRVFAGSADGNVYAYALPVTCPVGANSIVCENEHVGAIRAEWDVAVGGTPGIEGFASDISVDHGSTVRFKVNTVATAYHLDVYRLGYYGGDGARKVATVLPAVSLPQRQPACLNDTSTHLVDCGNWVESASWPVPADAVSGVYIAKIVRDDGSSGANHIVFIVRDDEAPTALLFQTSDPSWQAYNDYGGEGLYTVGSDGKKAVKASYNRPFTTRMTNPPGYLFGTEYPMLRFLERNGYSVSYAAGVDTDRFGSHLLSHRVFLSVGHDEYWSDTQRAHVDTARDHGINLAFFSGDGIYWKTRWEASIDSTATPYRTLVTYKETCDPFQNVFCTPSTARLDPTSTWTGLWRDHRFSPPSDGGRPETATSGQAFVDACCTANSITVSAEEGALRLWRATGLAAMAPGTTASVGDRVLGYEWDQDLDNGARPAGLVDLSTTDLTGQTGTPEASSPSQKSGPTSPTTSRTLPNDTLITPGSRPLHTSPAGASAPTDTEPVCVFANSSCIHHLVMYRASSGALVFGAGTVQWSYGLDGNSDTQTTPDPRIQQATVNVLADMHAQPATLMSGLVATTASTDTTPPSSTVTSPITGSTTTAGSTVTVSGTADDADGHVAGVEVSTDGGSAWHPAKGRANWSYTFRPLQSSGAIVIRARATDDSGNTETPGPGVTITVVPRPCPCTMFDQSAPATPDSQQAAPIEVGVKFGVDTPGTITGVRFYKSIPNTGTHTGHLWTASGTLLATVTFTNESASGWQDATFIPPVPVNAGGVYVASYHTNAGHTADDAWFSTLPLYDFDPRGVDNTPLHMLSGNGALDRNGVFAAGASAFPDQLSLDENYWVDVDFVP